MTKRDLTDLNAAINAMIGKAEIEEKRIAEEQRRLAQERVELERRKTSELQNEIEQLFKFLLSADSLRHLVEKCLGKDPSARVALVGIHGKPQNTITIGDAATAGEQVFSSLGSERQLLDLTKHISLYRDVLYNSPLQSSLLSPLAQAGWIIKFREPKSYKKQEFHSNSHADYTTTISVHTPWYIEIDFSKLGQR